jgi:hypothetical protein
MGAQETRAATAALRPVKPRGGKPRFAGWANARNDVADYGRLAELLGPRLLPVRPVGRKPPHVPGQIPLWGGPP